jgi:hypothetical protein
MRSFIGCKAQQIRDGRSAGAVGGPPLLYTYIHRLYSSPSIIRMIKSRRMRWAGHVARLGEKRNAYRILVGSQKVRDHWEDLDVSVRVM